MHWPKAQPCLSAVAFSKRALFDQAKLHNHSLKTIPTTSLAALTLARKNRRYTRTYQWCHVCYQLSTLVLHSLSLYCVLPFQCSGGVDASVGLDLPAMCLRSPSHVSLLLHHATDSAAATSCDAFERYLILCNYQFDAQIRRKGTRMHLYMERLPHCQ